MSDAVLSPAANGQAQAAVQPRGTEATTTEAPFFDYAWEDGKKDVYKTKEELAKAYRDGVLRYADYTKKTQELAKKRAEHEKREQEFSASAEKIMSLQKKYDPMDDFLRKRPDVEKYIVENMRGPSQDAQEAQFKALIEQYTKPLQDKLTEAEKWKKEQEDGQNEAKLYLHMKTQYPDFDEEGVRAMQKEYDESPEGDEKRAFLELLHFARKGRTAPAKIEVEQEIAEKAQRKIGKSSPVPSTNSTSASEGAAPVVRGGGDPIKAAVEAYKRTH